MDKSTLINHAQKNIDKLQEGINIVANLPSEVMEEVVGGFIGDGASNVFLYIPYDLQTYRKVRRILNREGWKVNRVYSHRGTRNAVLKNGSDVSINIDMDTSDPRSTCKKVVANEKEVTRTVREYKITCH